MGDVVGGLFGGDQQQSSSSASFYDPFQSYRAKYAKQLETMLLGSPEKVSNTLKNQPGYQFGLNQGQQTLERQLAASGQTQSGQEQLALQNYGQGYASNFYNNYVNQLASLAGANIGPIQSGGTQTTTSTPGLGTIIGQGIGTYFGGSMLGLW